MKKTGSLLFICLTFAIVTAKAQSLAINTTGATANSSAILDVSSTSKGILIPRMSSVQRTGIGTPANGLLVYDNDSLAFAYYNGAAWSFIKGNNNIAAGWSIKGNAGTTAANFMGTTDNQDVFFKRNNINAGLLNISNTAFGVNAFLTTTGGFNTAFGGGALSKNIVGGSYNTANGWLALNNNTSGVANTANGSSALDKNTTANYNTANGSQALFGNTTGWGNTADGFRALYDNTTGYSNVAIGIDALYKNTVRSNLVAIGDSALYNNGTGATLPYHATFNTAIGSKALFNNTTGAYNTANGIYALSDNTTGNNNTANGSQALTSNSTGNNNTANGYHALLGNNTGDNNTASGSNALQNNDNGSNNTANGVSALFNNSTGSYNTANGSNALSGNSTGFYNTANGYYALLSNNTGSYNTANGAFALVSNNGGFGNTANGSNALYSNTTGSNNTANGDSALQRNTTGYSNVAIGKAALYNNTNRSNLVAIGDSALFNNGIGAVSAVQATNNTAVGSKALYNNTTGNHNTANGHIALYRNTTGYHNTANGFGALYNNTTGFYNTANGSLSLETNSTGNSNTATGNFALRQNTTGNHNTANGLSALEYNTAGSYNTANGYGASYNTNTGSHNTAMGNNALVLNQTGNLNTAIGDSALYFNTASLNTALGAYALSQNTTGTNNVAVGVKAGSSPANDNGSYNTYIGDSTMMFDRINSTVIGSKALTTTNNSMVLGSINGVNGATADVKVGIGVTNPTEKLEIGNGRLRFRGNAPLGNAHGITWTNNTGTTDRAFIGMETDDLFGIFNFGLGNWNVRVHNTSGEVGIFKQPNNTSGFSRLQVKQSVANADRGISIETAINTNRWDMWVDNNAGPDYNFSYNGGLKGYIQNGTGNYIVVSDKRFKKDVSNFSVSLSNINQLKTYQYHYLDNSATDPFSIGFMAQDVQKLFPDAVSEKVMDDGKKRLGVNYQYFTVLAIKGLQEQQENIETQNKKMEILETQIAELKKLVEQLIKN